MSKASMAADAYTRATINGKLLYWYLESFTLQGMACSYYDSIPSLYISVTNVTSALKNKNIDKLVFKSGYTRYCSSFYKYVEVMDQKMQFMR